MLTTRFTTFYRGPVQNALIALTALALSACGGGFGNSPLVLTEVPNQSSGRDFIAKGAELSGCRVDKSSDRHMVLACADGTLDVPTFEGPPTFAVRCVDDRLRDVPRCKALVRKLLMAADADREPKTTAKTD